MPTLDLAKLYGYAKEAVESIRETRKSAVDDLTNFTERQLEHEIGANLGKDGFVTYYDCLYPPPHNKKRADLLTWRKKTYLKSSGDPCIWIEVKFTDSINDNLSQLTYQKDFDNLALPKKGMWGCPHHKYWVWLYVFKRKSSSVELSTENKSAWLRRMNFGQVIQRLKGQCKRQTLMHKVEEISKNKRIIKEACSIIPSPDPKNPDLAALLIVVRLT